MSYIGRHCKADTTSACAAQVPVVQRETFISLPELTLFRDALWLSRCVDLRQKSTLDAYERFRDSFANKIYKFHDRTSRLALPAACKFVEHTKRNLNFTRQLEGVPRPIRRMIHKLEYWTKAELEGNTHKMNDDDDDEDENVDLDKDEDDLLDLDEEDLASMDQQETKDSNEYNNGMGQEEFTDDLENEDQAALSRGAIASVEWDDYESYFTRSFAKRTLDLAESGVSFTGVSTLAHFLSDPLRPPLSNEEVCKTADTSSQHFLSVKRKRTQNAISSPSPSPKQPAYMSPNRVGAISDAGQQSTRDIINVCPPDLTRPPPVTPFSPGYPQPRQRHSLDMSIARMCSHVHYLSWLVQEAIFAATASHTSIPANQALLDPAIQLAFPVAAGQSIPPKFVSQMIKGASKVANDLKRLIDSSLNAKSVSQQHNEFDSAKETKDELKSPRVKRTLTNEGIEIRRNDQLTTWSPLMNGATVRGVFIPPVIMMFLADATYFISILREEEPSLDGENDLSISPALKMLMQRDARGSFRYSLNYPLLRADSILSAYVRTVTVVLQAQPSKLQLDVSLSFLLPNLSKLFRRLDLSCNAQLGEEASRILFAFIARSRSIASIDLSGCGISDPLAIRLLAIALPASNLRDISLSHQAGRPRTHLGSEGALSLAEALKNPATKLRRLALAGVGVLGIERLLESGCFAHAHSLEALDLSGNGITNGMLAMLCYALIDASNRAVSLQQIQRKTHISKKEKTERTLGLRSLILSHNQLNDDLDLNENYGDSKSTHLLSKADDNRLTDFIPDDADEAMNGSAHPSIVKSSVYAVMQLLVRVPSLRRLDLSFNDFSPTLTTLISIAFTSGHVSIDDIYKASRANRFVADIESSSIRTSGISLKLMSKNEGQKTGVTSVKDKNTVITPHNSAQLESRSSAARSVFATASTIRKQQQSQLQEDVLRSAASASKIAAAISSGDVAEASFSQIKSDKSRKPRSQVNRPTEASKIATSLGESVTAAAATATASATSLMRQAHDVIRNELAASRRLIESAEKAKERQRFKRRLKSQYQNPPNRVEGENNSTEQRDLTLRDDTSDLIDEKESPESKLEVDNTENETRRALASQKRPWRTARDKLVKGRMAAQALFVPAPASERFIGSNYLDHFKKGARGRYIDWGKNFAHARKNDATSLRLLWWKLHESDRVDALAAAALAIKSLDTKAKEDDSENRSPLYNKTQSEDPHKLAFSFDPDDYDTSDEEIEEPNTKNTSSLGRKKVTSRKKSYENQIKSGSLFYENAQEELKAKLKTRARSKAKAKARALHRAKKSALISKKVGIGRQKTLLKLWRHAQLLHERSRERDPDTLRYSWTYRGSHSIGGTTWPMADIDCGRNRWGDELISDLRGGWRIRLALRKLLLHAKCKAQEKSRAIAALVELETRLDAEAKANKDVSLSSLRTVDCDSADEGEKFTVENKKKVLKERKKTAVPSQQKVSQIAPYSYSGMFGGRSSSADLWHRRHAQMVRLQQQKLSVLQKRLPQSEQVRSGPFGAVVAASSPTQSHIMSGSPRAKKEQVFHFGRAKIGGLDAGLGSLATLSSFLGSGLDLGAYVDPASRSGLEIEIIEEGDEIAVDAVDPYQRLACIQTTDMIKEVKPHSVPTTKSAKTNSTSENSQKISLTGNIRSVLESDDQLTVPNPMETRDKNSPITAAEVAIAASNIGGFLGIPPPTCLLAQNRHIGSYESGIETDNMFSTDEKSSQSHAVHSQNDSISPKPTTKSSASNTEMPRVDVLRLSRNEVSNGLAYGMLSLHRLSRRPAIHTIILDGTVGIGNSGLSALANALKDKASPITRLSLKRCGIFDASPLVEAIASSNSLERVDLSDNSITSEDATALFWSLLGNESITHIDLSSNTITNSAAPMLAATLVLNRTLESVILKDNRFTSLSAALFIRAIQLGRGWFDSTIANPNEVNGSERNERDNGESKLSKENDENHFESPIKTNKNQEKIPPLVAAQLSSVASMLRRHSLSMAQPLLEEHENDTDVIGPDSNDKTETKDDSKNSFDSDAQVINEALERIIEWSSFDPRSPQGMLQRRVSSMPSTWKHTQMHPFALHTIDLRYNRVDPALLARLDQELDVTRTIQARVRASMRSERLSQLTQLKEMAHNARKLVRESRQACIDAREKAESLELEGRALVLKAEKESSELYALLREAKIRTESLTGVGLEEVKANLEKMRSDLDQRFELERQELELAIERNRLEKAKMELSLLVVKELSTQGVTAYHEDMVRAEALKHIASRESAELEVAREVYLRDSLRLRAVTGRITSWYAMKLARFGTLFKKAKEQQMHQHQQQQQIQQQKQSHGTGIVVPTHRRAQKSLSDLTHLMRSSTGSLTPTPRSLSRLSFNFSPSRRPSGFHATNAENPSLYLWPRLIDISTNLPTHEEIAGLDVRGATAWIAHSFTQSNGPISESSQCVGNSFYPHSAVQESEMAASISYDKEFLVYHDSVCKWLAPKFGGNQSLASMSSRRKYVMTASDLPLVLCRILPSMKSYVSRTSHSSLQSPIQNDLPVNNWDKLKELAGTLLREGETMATQTDSIIEIGQTTHPSTSKIPPKLWNLTSAAWINVSAQRFAHEACNELEYDIRVTGMRDLRYQDSAFIETALEKIAKNFAVPLPSTSLTSPLHLSMGKHETVSSPAYLPAMLTSIRVESSPNRLSGIAVEIPSSAYRKLDRGRRVSTIIPYQMRSILQQMSADPTTTANRAYSYLMHISSNSSTGGLPESLSSIFSIAYPQQPGINIARRNSSSYENRDQNVCVTKEPIYHSSTGIPPVALIDRFLRSVDVSSLYMGTGWVSGVELVAVVDQEVHLKLALKKRGFLSRKLEALVVRSQGFIGGAPQSLHAEINSLRMQLASLSHPSLLNEGPGTNVDYDNVPPIVIEDELWIPRSVNGLQVHEIAQNSLNKTLDVELSYNATQDASSSSVQTHRLPNQKVNRLFFVPCFGLDAGEVPHPLIPSASLDVRALNSFILIIALCASLSEGYEPTVKLARKQSECFDFQDKNEPANDTNHNFASVTNGVLNIDGEEDDGTEASLLASRLLASSLPQILSCQGSDEVSSNSSNPIKSPRSSSKTLVSPNRILKDSELDNYKKSAPVFPHVSLSLLKLPLMGAPVGFKVLIKSLGSKPCELRFTNGMHFPCRTRQNVLLLSSHGQFSSTLDEVLKERLPQDSYVLSENSSQTSQGESYQSTSTNIIHEMVVLQEEVEMCERLVKERTSACAKVASTRALMCKRLTDVCYRLASERMKLRKRFKQLLIEANILCQSECSSFLGNNASFDNYNSLTLGGNTSRSSSRLSHVAGNSTPASLTTKELSTIESTISPRGSMVSVQSPRSSISNAGAIIPNEMPNFFAIAPFLEKNYNQAEEPAAQLPYQIIGVADLDSVSGAYVGDVNNGSNEEDHSGDVGEFLSPVRSLSSSSSASSSLSVSSFPQPIRGHPFRGSIVSQRNSLKSFPYHTNQSISTVQAANCFPIKQVASTSSVISCVFLDPQKSFVSLVSNLMRESQATVNTQKEAVQNVQANSIPSTFVNQVDSLLKDIYVAVYSSLGEDEIMIKHSHGSTKGKAPASTLKSTAFSQESLASISISETQPIHSMEEISTAKNHSTFVLAPKLVEGLPKFPLRLISSLARMLASDITAAVEKKTPSSPSAIEADIKNSPSSEQASINASTHVFIIDTSDKPAQNGVMCFSSIEANESAETGSSTQQTYVSLTAAQSLSSLDSDPSPRFQTPSLKKNNSPLFLYAATAKHSYALWLSHVLDNHVNPNKYISKMESSEQKQAVANVQRATRNQQSKQRRHPSDKEKDEPSSSSAYELASPDHQSDADVMLSILCEAWPSRYSYGLSCDFLSFISKSVQQKKSNQLGLKGVDTHASDAGWERAQGGGGGDMVNRSNSNLLSNWESTDSVKNHTTFGTRSIDGPRDLPWSSSNQNERLRHQQNANSPPTRNSRSPPASGTETTEDFVPVERKKWKDKRFTMSPEQKRQEFESKHFEAQLELMRSPLAYGFDESKLKVLGLLSPVKQFSRSREREVRNEMGVFARLGRDDAQRQRRAALQKQSLVNGSSKKKGKNKGKNHTNSNMEMGDVHDSNSTDSLSTSASSPSYHVLSAAASRSAGMATRLARVKNEHFDVTVIDQDTYFEEEQERKRDKKLKRLKKRKRQSKLNEPSQKAKKGKRKSAKRTFTSSPKTRDAILSTWDNARSAAAIRSERQQRLEAQKRKKALKNVPSKLYEPTKKSLLATEQSSSHASSSSQAHVKGKAHTTAIVPLRKRMPSLISHSLRAGYALGHGGDNQHQDVMQYGDEGKEDNEQNIQDREDCDNDENDPEILHERMMAYVESAAQKRLDSLNHKLFENEEESPLNPALALVKSHRAASGQSADTHRQAPVSLVHTFQMQGDLLSKSLGKEAMQNLIELDTSLTGDEYLRKQLEIAQTELLERVSKLRNFIGVNDISSSTDGNQISLGNAVIAEKLGGISEDNSNIVQKMRKYSQQHRHSQSTTHTAISSVNNLQGMASPTTSITSPEAGFSAISSTTPNPLSPLDTIKPLLYAVSDKKRPNDVSQQSVIAPYSSFPPSGAVLKQESTPFVIPPLSSLPSSLAQRLSLSVCGTKDGGISDGTALSPIRRARSSRVLVKTDDDKEKDIMMREIGNGNIPMLTPVYASDLNISALPVIKSLMNVKEKTKSKTTGEEGERARLATPTSTGIITTEIDFTGYSREDIFPKKHVIPKYRNSKSSANLHSPRLSQLHRGGVSRNGVDGGSASHSPRNHNHATLTANGHLSSTQKHSSSHLILPDIVRRSVVD